MHATILVGRPALGDRPRFPSPSMGEGQGGGEDVGEGQGGGEDAAIVPPSRPSPTRGEGDVTSPTSPSQRLGGGSGNQAGHGGSAMTRRTTMFGWAGVGGLCVGLLLWNLGAAQAPPPEPPPKGRRTCRWSKWTLPPCGRVTSRPSPR